MVIRLSDKFGVSFNAGATSDMKIMTDKVSLLDQGVFNVFRHFNFSNQAPIQYSQEETLLVRWLNLITTNTYT
jgi:hypothetical protein